jgi:antitoxin component YwqK of YwqJK toxin-antitoxin module
MRIVRLRRPPGAVAAALLAGACATPHTLCPEGTDISRRILSGGSEAEWCRRDDGVRQGPEVRFYESGAKMVEGAYLDGVLHGLWRYYFNEGSVWREDRWEDGALVAKRIDPRAARLSRRQLDALGPTSSGVIKLASADPLLGRAARQRGGGVFQSWYANGKPRMAGSYDGDGLRTGTWRFWYESGGLAREVDYQAGVRHRAFREWYEGGAPETDGFYLDGERDGAWRRWDPSGRAIFRP